jgi:hypothetical protein
MDRRPLRLADLDAVAREAESLLANGYTRGGRWSLGQNADHLAQAIERSMDGYPMLLPAPVRWLIRWLMLKKVLRHDVINRKVDAPKWLMPPDSVEDRAGVERLKAAVERYKAFRGTPHPSPVFGNLTYDECREVHVWHSEHHLSFLKPARAHPTP